MGFLGFQTRRNFELSRELTLGFKDLRCTPQDVQVASQRNLHHHKVRREDGAQGREGEEEVRVSGRGGKDSDSRWTEAEGE